MRLVDREKSYWNPAQPVESILPGQALRRKIQQAIVASLRIDHDPAVLGRILETVDRGRRNPHLRQLRRLVLHEGDQRRNYYRRFAGHHRRELVAQRLTAPGRHHDTSIAPRQQAADDTFLLGAKFVVSPVAPQRLYQIRRWFWHDIRLVQYRRA